MEEMCRGQPTICLTARSDGERDKKSNIDRFTIEQVTSTRSKGGLKTDADTDDVRRIRARIVRERDERKKGRKHIRQIGERERAIKYVQYRRVKRGQEYERDSGAIRAEGRAGRGMFVCGIVSKCDEENRRQAKRKRKDEKICTDKTSE